MDLEKDLEKDELSSEEEPEEAEKDSGQEDDYEPIIGAYTKDDIFTRLIEEARARSDEKAREQAEKQSDEDDEIFIAGDGLDDDDFEDIPKKEEPEKESAPDISVSVNESAKPKKDGLAKRIRNAEVLKPEVIKDMFFGSRDAESDHRFAPEDAEQYEEEDIEDPVVFDRNRKKRIAADPNQDKMIFSVEYMLTPDQALDGYMLFYNEFIRKSNIKLTFIMGILAAVFLFSVIISPKGYLNYMLLLMTLSVIALKWINSEGAKKEALSSADDVINDSYRLDFYNSRILLKASELTGDKIYNYPPVMIRFEDIDLKVLDYEELYVLIFKKNYVYTVPKSAMNDEQNRVFRRLLESILGDDYYEFYSREREAAERAVRRKKEKAEKAGKEEESEKPAENEDKDSGKKSDDSNKKKEKDKEKDKKAKQ